MLGTFEGELVERDVFDSPALKHHGIDVVCQAPDVFGVVEHPDALTVRAGKLVRRPTFRELPEGPR
jgi:hypothetical protein